MQNAAPRRILTPYQLMNLPRNIPQGSNNSSGEQTSIKRDYWYEYDDIDRLLKDSAQNGLYHVIDAASQDHGSLTARVREAVEKVNNSDGPNAAVIPLNIGSSTGGIYQGSHWVSLVIKKYPDEVYAFYSDSMGTRLAMNFPKLTEILTNSGINKKNIIDFAKQQQLNGYDCGPWTVFNSISIATDDRLPNNIDDTKVKDQRNKLYELNPKNEMINTINKKLIKKRSRGQIEFIDLIPGSQLPQNDEKDSLTKKRSKGQQELIELSFEDIIQSTNSEFLQNNTMTLPFFPNCQYYSRFSGRTIYPMNQFIEYGNYIRSIGGSTTNIDKTDYSTIITPPTVTTTNKKTGEVISKPLEFNAAHTHLGFLRHLQAKLYVDLKQHEKPGKANNLFKNSLPVTELESKIAKAAITKFLEKSNSITLKDLLIDYHLNICKLVKTKIAANSKNITVMNKVENDEQGYYPCICIDFNIMQHCDQYYRGSNILKEGLQKMIIGYFIGIANAMAYHRGINIEIVKRSSFGHLAPTIDNFAENFIRITPGLVPQVYADILADTAIMIKQLFDDFKAIDISLEDLKKSFSNIIKTNYNKDEEKQYIAGVNPEAYYKSKKTKIFNLYNFILVPLTQNKTVTNAAIHELMRHRQNLETLATSVMNELLLPANYGKSLNVESPKMLSLYLDLASSMYIKIHKKITKDGKIVIDKTTTIDENVAESVKAYKLQTWSKPQIADIAEDTNFWEVVNFMFSVLGSKWTADSNLELLYASLEQAHLLFFKQAVIAKTTPTVNDLLGSDSDGSGIVDGQQFYANASKVNFGMTAITLAWYLTKLCFYRNYFPTGKGYQIQSIQYYIKHCYYEVSKNYLEFIDPTPEAKTRAAQQNLSVSIESKAPCSSSLRFVQDKIGTSNCDILILDFNDSNMTTSILHSYDSRLKNSNILILDYTATKSIDVQRYINNILSNNTKELGIIFLVESGTKYGQASSDTISYGTLRILTYGTDTVNANFV